MSNLSISHNLLVFFSFIYFMPLSGFTQQVSYNRNCSGITESDTCLNICGKDTLTSHVMYNLPHYWMKSANIENPSKSETWLIGGKKLHHSIVFTMLS